MENAAYLRGYCQGAKLVAWLLTYSREVAYLSWLLDAQAADRMLLGHGGDSARAFLTGKLDALLDAVS
jgi:hypothetical protein